MEMFTIISLAKVIEFYFCLIYMNNVSIKNNY
jgi:hypothetical protein